LLSGADVICISTAVAQQQTNPAFRDTFLLLPQMSFTDMAEEYAFWNPFQGLDDAEDAGAPAGSQAVSGGQAQAGPAVAPSVAIASMGGGGAAPKAKAKVAAIPVGARGPKAKAKAKANVGGGAAKAKPKAKGKASANAGAEGGAAEPKGKAKGKGKTKAKANPDTRESPKRDWCFTLNNPTPEELDHLWNDPEPEVEYMVIGDEVGASGTRHFQGYVELVKKVRWATLKAWIPRAHWEARRGTSDQASRYCKKDGRFVEKGNISHQRHGQLKEEMWQRFIDQIQAHETWGAVVQDPKLASLVATKMQWARNVFEQRPQKPFTLDVAAAGFRWQVRFELFLTKAKPDDRKVI
jgi:hypothetical protein